VSPNFHRQAIRREYSSWSRTATGHEPDPSVDRADGHREPCLGYTRIEGALANVNHEVSRGPIATVLREDGLEPAPDRLNKTTWTEFLKMQWDVLAAADSLPWTSGPVAG
jgi:hypothetical protein